MPWDYRSLVKSMMSPDAVMLDAGTGGGEFLVSLSPPAGNTYATEGYTPNLAVARAALSPHGIEVRETSGNALPFKDGFFDLVINRHASYSLPEVLRVLKSGGSFITQQVGRKNNRELSAFLLGKPPDIKCCPESLPAAKEQAESLGFEIILSEECFPETRYLDTGALGFMARILVWEFRAFRWKDAWKGLHCFRASLSHAVTFLPANTDIFSV